MTICSKISNWASWVINSCNKLWGWRRKKRWWLEGWVDSDVCACVSACTCMSICICMKNRLHYSHTLVLMHRSHTFKFQMIALPFVRQHFLFFFFRHRSTPPQTRSCWLWGRGHPVQFPFFFLTHIHHGSRSSLTQWIQTRICMEAVTTDCVWWAQVKTGLHSTSVCVSQPGIKLSLLSLFTFLR